MQIIRNTGNVSFLTDDGDIYKIVFPNAIIDVIDSQFLQVKFGQELMRINAEDVTATKTLSGVLTAFSGNAYDLAIILQDIFFFDVAGGGGASDLETVLGIGNNTGPNNIDVDFGYGIRFNNGSVLKEGTIDAALGGAKGIAQICAVGYELKWEAGRLYVMDGNGVYIRWSLYNFTLTPTVNDDVTKGYLPGSRWSLDNGDIYVCTDETTGAAVWELEVNQLATIVKTKVVNKTTPSVTLSKADYQVCLVSGAQGQRLAVRLAKADSDANSAGTLGIASETILINQEGFITSIGAIEDINTTGSLQGETWADGDILYLSPSTFGAVTNVKPVAPDHTVIVGYVEYAHVNHGKIYVKIDNGYELDELHNVKINSGTLANNNILAYTSATQVWENKTPASVLGFTPAASEGWNVIVKTANHDVTNTIIPQDDPELQFSVVANGSYMVEMDFCWSGNNATSDYQGNFNVTAGLMTGYGLIFSSYQTTPILLVSNNAASPTFGNFQLVSASITFLMSCKVQFNFTCTQNATFKYQLRNAIAGAGWTSRTWKGSILKYKRID